MLRAKRVHISVCPMEEKWIKIVIIMGLGKKVCKIMKLIWQ